MVRLRTRAASLGAGLCLVLTLVVPVLQSAPAGAAGPIFFDGTPGTAAPPATLGPYTMTAFGPDATADNTDVTSVVDPAGTVTFGAPLLKLSVPDTWGTWSHGYAGPVYFNESATAPVEITLPAQTLAFYFYAEPDAFDTFTVTATSGDGTTSGPIDVAGDSGAKYFGFYGDLANPLASITIVADEEAGGFAIGEFAIASGFTDTLSVTKAVVGNVVGTPTFTVDVTCTDGPKATTLTFDAAGGTQTVEVPGGPTFTNTCTVTETDAGGAAGVTYECADTSAFATEQDVTTAAIPEVCAVAGPQADPATVSFSAGGQTASVTVANVFLEPKFTG